MSRNSAECGVEGVVTLLYILCAGIYHLSSALNFKGKGVGSR